MANKVLLKKSSVSAKVPLTTDLDYGELALNYADGKLYYKTSTNDIASFNAAGGGSAGNAFTTISVSGQSSVAADSTTDTLTLAAGTGISITTNATTDTITLTNSGVTSVNGVTGAVTSSNLLTALLTVDGAGSGLDADLLDGVQGSSYVTLTGSQTLTNKTISASNNTISDLTNSNLSGSAGITNANLANSSVTIGSTSVSLGATATTIAGLTSVTSTSFVGALTGNADTATVLQTARTINGVSFDGSANITINAVDSTARIASSEKGAANGVATLDSSGLVPSTQLPSYVDDILEYSNLSFFPVTGETGKIYVAIDTNKTYRWSGSTYVFITSGAVDSVAGKTGVVTLDKSDVGLNNVDNTADSVKNVSSAATLTTARTINGVSFDGSANITVTANTTNALTIGSGLSLSSGTTFNGSSAVTISHDDTSSAANLTASGRTYVTGLTFDTFGHVTGYTTGTETVTDTNTTYAISAETATGGVNLRLTGSDSSTDDVKLAAGENISLTRTDANTITIASTASGGGGSTPWIFKTANYTASASDRIIATTTSGSFAITLPESPSAGDEVIIADGDNWQTNNLTVNRNGSTIKGLSENLIMDIAGVKAEFVYSGSTWLVFAFASGADDTLAISLAIGDEL